MIKNKTLKRCTVAIMIAVLLTFTVNKTVSVSAVAITGTVAAAALLATGAVYLGYLALTGAEIQLPRENVRQYVSDIGNKIAQYGTGAGLYATIYNHIFNNGIESVEDLDITLDADTLLGLYNTNKDISKIQEIASFTQSVLEEYPVTTDFEYNFDIVPAGEIVGTNNGATTLSNILATHTFPNWFRRAPAIVRVYPNYWNWYIYDEYSLYYRNVLKTNGYYGVQGSSDNETWHNITFAYNGFKDTDNGWLYIASFGGGTSGLYYSTNVSLSRENIENSTFPILTNSPIYIQSTGEIIETVQDENGVYHNNPQWPDNHEPDNNDNKYPLVPYVELPTSTPGEYVPSQWGINTGTLLDKLDDLADDMVTAGVIGELINAFKESLVGTDLYDRYEYYTNEGDNYYYYYNNTFQDNDTYNNNTDIQDDEYLMPVDLNTLSSVANNEYITTIKNTAADISQTVGDYIAFWHNVDYQTVYILLGGALFLLLCGLIGKMGK